MFSSPALSTSDHRGDKPVEQIPSEQIQQVDSPINILLVDDEPKNLSVLETILDDPGYRLVRADSADQALLALVREEFALIVLDIQMPGMSGFELAQMIKQRKKTADVPIIFLTAYYSEAEHILEGYGTGAVDYLHKPVNPVILRSKVSVFASLNRITKAKEKANQALSAEVAERRRVEAQLLKLNSELEQRVEQRTFELKRAHAEISESEELLRLAQEAGKVGIWSWDLRTGVGAWTSTTAMIFNLDGEDREITYARWLSYVHPQDRRRAQASLSHARETGTYWDELRIVSQKNETKWVELDGAIDYESNEPVRIRGVVRDITLRKKMELELKDAHRRKDEFLATLAHELRNPLAPIRNSLEVLKMSPADAATTRQVTGMMDRQLTHLVRLVDDLLDVSRVMGGKIELRKEIVDVRSIIEGAVETARPLIDDLGHHLTISFPDNSLIVNADPVRLIQIMTNLLTNAAKYTDPQGQIWLEAERNENEVVLRVRDSGIGIVPEMRKQIFELFVQVDQSTTRSQGGLGIGLTLVKNLVEMHEGSIDVHCEGLGQGCEFVIRLPGEAKELQNGQSVAKSTEPIEPISLNVLVADDNQDSAVSLAMLLQFQNHHVQVVYDGFAALEKIAELQPDIVFLDIGMPGMDGIEVANQVRLHPEWNQIVLVAVTGWGQEEDRRLTTNAGFNHHLVKPVNPKSLELIIADCSANQN